ncbi:NAD(P)-binding domain-containing protein [Kiloniella antarctica]|uniref:NAD(P)-binding domain-containing protein n=1 Tax=Kiloniella antarctica TaxID=1550907 RepID=A0ABW5BLS0_9PROT
MTDKPLSSMTIGILGVGYFASYFIAGLRKGGFKGQILLSPRNAQTANKLAQTHNCSIAVTNQDVIDHTDLVVVSVKPEHLQELLTGLSFKDDQIVVSAVAGISVENHHKTGPLPQTLIRMIPVCCIEAGEGVVPIYPAHKIVEDLARFTGAPVTFNTEEEFDLSLAASCMNGWLYEFFGSMTQWLENKGLPSETARTLVLHNVRGATGYALLKENEDLTSITNDIATEGTFTLKGLEVLRKHQGIIAWDKALDEVHANLIRDN